MRKFITAVLFLTLTSYMTPPAVQKSVYICVSSSASVYHQYDDCRGLKNCTHTIKSVSEDDAINKYGRRKCKVCY